MADQRTLGKKMKAAAIVIALILVVGGIAGLLNPRERIYPVQIGRYGGGSGVTTLSKESGRYFSIGSAMLGILVFGGTVWLSSKAKKDRAKKEPNQPLQRNASPGSVSNFESPARRG